MGKSPRDEAFEGLMSESSALNPNVENLFSNYKDPYSPEAILGSLDQYTNKAIGDLTKRTDTGINRARSATASRLMGQGVKGGSIFEDLMAGAENRVRVPAGETAENLVTQNLGMRPSVYNEGNRSKFRATAANQDVLFKNMANVFNKFNLRGGFAGQLDPTNTWDDIFEGLNAGANVVDAIIPG